MSKSTLRRAVMGQMVNKVEVARNTKCYEQKRRYKYDHMEPVGEHSPQRLFPSHGRRPSRSG